MLAADSLVLQFPVQWYATPPMLKQWQDKVLTRMFYVQPQDGAQLADRPLMVVLTAGNRQDAYAPDGADLFTMDALLAPLKATANRCGLAWTAPFVSHGVNGADPADLDAMATRYGDALAKFAATEHQLAAAAA